MSVCLLSALPAAGADPRGYWKTDGLQVLWGGGGAHGSTRCSLRTVTAVSKTPEKVTKRIWKVDTFSEKVAKLAALRHPLFAWFSM